MSGVNMQIRQTKQTHRHIQTITLHTRFTTEQRILPTFPPHSWVTYHGGSETLPSRDIEAHCQGSFKEEP